MDFIETDSGQAVDVIIQLPHGLHSRPSARLAQTARNYDADIHLVSDEGEVDAKSMLDILSLALGHNAKARILASGPQAREALTAIAAMLTDSGS